MASYTSKKQFCSYVNVSSACAILCLCVLCSWYLCVVWCICGRLSGGRCTKLAWYMRQREDYYDKLICPVIHCTPLTHFSCLQLAYTHTHTQSTREHACHIYIGTQWLLQNQTIAHTFTGQTGCAACIQATLAQMHKNITGLVDFNEHVY